MSKEAPSDMKNRMEKTLAGRQKEKFILRLFITGTTPASTAAILNLKKICDEYLDGRYELDVIDIYQHPEAARDEQIIAAPTLIKKLPLPIRKFIGNMADKERILAGLNLEAHDVPASPRGTVRKGRTVAQTAKPAGKSSKGRKTAKKS